MNETLITGIVDVETFFAPSTTGPIDALLAGYESNVQNIEDVSSFLGTASYKQTVKYFMDGCRVLNGNRSYFGSEELFDTKFAIASLNSEYWGRALALTDVMDYMPAKRRAEWNESIRELKTPDFEVGTVRDTLGSLMNQRMDFLAEMVDGIFTGLSGEHVTNRPEGFGKRMIIDNVYNLYYSGHKEGLIHDMRSVIAKFMGRTQPGNNSTARMLRLFRQNTGLWHSVDGNAFRIRVYKKGTAHLEINPEISFRLNQILAYLHPMAIPAPHRTRPNPRRKKEFVLIKNVIPFEVLNVIGDVRYNGPRSALYKNTLDMGMGWGAKDKHIKKAVGDVLQSIGGVFDGSWHYKFDYNAEDVIGNVLSSGLIPDLKSHQYYPTPDSLGEIVAELADIQTTDSILEPSAGQGGLSDHLPIDQVFCVEVSELNCSVLKSKGYAYDNVDFISWDGELFDKIVMNPPYSVGRAQHHIEKAATHLHPDGKLVAILPATFKGKDVLPGMDISWSEVYDDKFSGTSVRVVIMVAKFKLAQ